MRICYAHTLCQARHITIRSNRSRWPPGQPKRCAYLAALVRRRYVPLAVRVEMEEKLCLEFGIWRSRLATLSALLTSMRKKEVAPGTWVAEFEDSEGNRVALSQTSE